MDAQDLDALRTREYWEKRYDNEPSGHEFDWFKSYDDLEPWLNEILRLDDTILMLGCGNSVQSYLSGGSFAEYIQEPIFRALQEGLQKHPEH